MMNMTVGSKYNETKDYDIAIVAKLVRADIKAAVKAGTLPAAKYAVQIDRYSMGQELRVTISNVTKPGFVLPNEFRIRWDLEHPHGGLCGAPAEALGLWSGEAFALLAAVEEIVGAYNYKRTHSESGSYHDKFHAAVGFDSEWTSSLRDEMRAKVRADVEREKTGRAMFFAAVGRSIEMKRAAANETETNAQAAWLEAIGAV